MKRTGLVIDTYDHGLQITEKGRKRLKKAHLEEIKISKPDKWDGKWRIVLFDVPEDRKTARDTLTRKLKEMNFFQLQKSVWLCPYNCRQEIETVAAILEVDSFVTYIETSYIDKQERLVRHFKI